MDHGQALATKASERYLLGEMSEPERFEFEGHYFVCETCAEDVRAGVAFARGVKAIFTADEASAPSTAPSSEARKKRGWFDWLNPFVLAPSAAAVALAVVAGYQGLVLVPSLRHDAAPQAVEPVILRSAARGEEPAIHLNQTTRISVLALDVNSGEPGSKLAYQLLPPSGAAALSGSAEVPPAGTELLLVLPKATLQHSGVWNLILRTSQGTEVGRYPFRIETN